MRATTDAPRLGHSDAGQLVNVLEGHTDRVRAVAINDIGSRAVSASDDHTLRVWDVSSGRTIHVLEGHTQPVRAVALEATGSFAVSASDDRTLLVWNIATGQCVAGPYDLPAAATSLALAHCEPHIAWFGLRRRHGRGECVHVTGVTHAVQATESFQGLS